MDTIWHVLVELAKTIYAVVLLAVAVRAFLLWLAGRVRVTDWLGYVVHAIFLAAGLISLLDQWRAWSALPVAFAVSAGVWWLLKDREVLRRRDNEERILGFFLVNRKHVPAGVRNWFS